MVCVCFRIKIIIILIIVVIVCNSDGYTVGNDDYSAKHSRCDGEPHENASLWHKIMKENMHSYHKLSCFTSAISVQRPMSLTSFAMGKMTAHLFCQPVRCHARKWPFGTKQADIHVAGIHYLNFRLLSNKKDLLAVELHGLEKKMDNILT